MREFKNNFKEMGYLHEESIQPKHMVKMHEFSDIAEIYYSNAEELNELLSK